MSHSTVTVICMAPPSTAVTMTDYASMMDAGSSGRLRPNLSYTKTLAPQLRGDLPHRATTVRISAFGGCAIEAADGDVAVGEGSVAADGEEPPYFAARPSSPAMVFIASMQNVMCSSRSMPRSA